jgi:hypothetical protein
MYKQLESMRAAQQVAVTGTRGSAALGRSPQAAAAEDAVLLEPTSVAESEEVLIVDGRAKLGPAELVEHKLSNLLRSTPISISHARLSTVCGRRRSF